MSWDGDALSYLVATENALHSICRGTKARIVPSKSEDPNWTHDCKTKKWFKTLICARRKPTLIAIRGSSQVSNLEACRNSVLMVPMLKENGNSSVLLLACTTKKFDPSPTNRSLWLMSFAAQAVIAIENARLLNEIASTNKLTLTERTADLTEAPEQQTATLGSAASHQFTCRRT